MKVLIVYHIPSTLRRSFEWSDGFAAGIELLAKQWDVAWYNVDVDDPAGVGRLQDYDFVLAKSNWGWVVDSFVRDELSGSPTRRGIAVSGSSMPPSGARMKFYDAVFYETDWYRPFLSNHPLTVHAFGVNTDTMNPSVQQRKKEIDWLTVGAFRRHKRQWLILDRPGAKVAIGDISEGDPEILDTLRRGGVTILDYMGQEALAEMYGRAKGVYIPAELQGGGERAVLEARACGTNVIVESDNPKLTELVTMAEVPDHRYYANQLARGIEAAFLAPPRGYRQRRVDSLLRIVPDRREVRRRVGRIRAKMARGSGGSEPGLSDSK